MPAAKHISRSPCMAFAVMATMRGRSSGRQREQIVRVASRPSISGICTSMSTTSYTWRRTDSIASMPFDARSAR